MCESSVVRLCEGPCEAGLCASKGVRGASARLALCDEARRAHEAAAAVGWRATIRVRREDFCEVLCEVAGVCDVCGSARVVLRRCRKSVAGTRLPASLTV